MDVYVLSASEELLGIRGDAKAFVHNEADYTINAFFPYDETQVQITENMKLGFYDVDNNFQVFEVTVLQKSYPNGCSIYAEHIAMAEMLDGIITDVRPSEIMAGFAVTAALQKSIWELGTAEDTAVSSINFYYETEWSAMNKIKKEWNCHLVFACTINDTGITGRYVHVYQRAGQDRGKRLELDKDIDKHMYTVDITAIKTSAYGRGRGEIVGTTEEGNATYGRRTTFADVVWSIANGDPADKPAGQEYVEDVAATSAYGRKGKARTDVFIFEDCSDPTELLQRTWDKLQSVKNPLVSVEITIIDYEAKTGEAHEAVRYGDTVAVIIDELTIQMSAQIVDIKRDYIDNMKTNLVVGNIIPSLPEQTANNQSIIKGLQEQANVGNLIAKLNPTLLQSYIDVTKTRILSTGTNLLTEPDGSFVWTADDGLSATKICGRGLLVANSKTNGEWNWTTIMDGNGGVATAFTSGILQASLIKIFGSDQFYWDNTNIFLIDPSDANKQIRIGKYDGTNLGIAVTRDGGTSWQHAINFDGVDFSSSSLASDIANLSDAITALDTIVTTALRVRPEGVYIGRTGALTSLLAAADELSFIDSNNNKVAWIDPSTFHITNAEITKQITMAPYTLMRMPDGSLGLAFMEV